MAARIRKGDTVVVITGADKGRRGEVLRVFPRANRAIVQGVRMVTKHVKQTGDGKTLRSDQRRGEHSPVEPDAGRSDLGQADKGRVPHSG